LRSACATAVPIVNYAKGAVARLGQAMETTLLPRRDRRSSASGQPQGGVVHGKRGEKKEAQTAAVAGGYYRLLTRNKGLLCSGERASDRQFIMRCHQTSIGPPNRWINWHRGKEGVTVEHGHDEIRKRTLAGWVHLTRPALGPTRPGFPNSWSSHMLYTYWHAPIYKGLSYSRTVTRTRPSAIGVLTNTPPLLWIHLSGAAKQ